MDKLIERLENIYKVVFSRTDKLEFNRHNAQHLYSICMHGSVLESASACITLLNNKEWTAVPALLRNLLEEYVDLVNVRKDPDYLKRMQCSFLKEQSRVLKKAIDSGDANPYLEALSNCEGVDSHYEKVISELAALRSSGFGELGIRDRFDRARLVGMYESVYALLCQHSHNNLNILESRHLEEYGDSVRVAYFQPWSADDMMPYINTIAGVVVGSLKEVAAVLGVEREFDIEEIDNELIKLRSLY